MRSVGRCEVPVRMVTVKAVPSTFLARHRDAAAMEAGQLLYQGESNTGAFMGAGSTVFDAVETLEHPRQVGLGNTDAGVADTRARCDRCALAM